ncbi:MAG TPA: MFS transporter [Spirochaetia bacterium]|nr:MFS transporter [Spirochaetia bacterium]
MVRVESAKEPTDSSNPTGASSALGAKAALFFVILMGCVSLFSDMTYEGARSITGPFLKVLGASATAVGVVAGLGELIGHTVRLASGVIADRTRRYWTLTILGYAVNLIAVPLIALSGDWVVASILMVAERFGKAIRKPSGDAMLSFARQTVGSGWTYGLHEAMDQIGAVTGPVIVAAVLYLKADNYRLGFAVLAIPALVGIAIVVATRFLYKDPSSLEVKTPSIGGRGLGSRYWLYMVAVGFVALGFADWALVAYHFEARKLFSDATIPLLYALAMGVDAVAALIFGRFYDRVGSKTLVVASVLSAGFAPLAFLGGPIAAAMGAVLWGIGMGWQESIMRSVVADLAPKEKRASAFGLFNTGYGILWFAGSALIGFLYGRSMAAMITFSVAAQLASVPLFLVLALRKGKLA